MIKLLPLNEEIRKNRGPINRLNDLSGKDWIKFTKSWFKHSPPPRDRTKLVHPAGFPETLVREFVEFFTKPNMWVLDPFMGTGSTLLAARAAGRNAVGVEINPRYASMARSRLEEAPPSDGTLRSEEHTSELQSLRHLVCRLLLEKKNIPTARF